MFLKIAKKIFGSSNDRFLKKLEKDVININNAEKKYEKLSDNELTPPVLHYIQKNALYGYN